MSDDDAPFVDVEFPSAPDFFEAPTARSSATMRIYATVLSAFDALGDSARTDLAEIACLFADATPEQRARMLAEVRRVAG